MLDFSHRKQDVNVGKYCERVNAALESGIKWSRGRSVHRFLKKSILLCSFTFADGKETLSCISNHPPDETQELVGHRLPALPRHPSLSVRPSSVPGTGRHEEIMESC